MLTAGKWALAIVPGGIILGALLGAAANPEMKDAPAPWWRMTGTEQIFASNDYLVEAGPEDLDAFAGYRPDLDYDAEVWELPIPAYELAALADEPLAPLPDELPTVSYGITAEDVAAEAEAVAEDAIASQAQPEPAPAPEPAEVRKSELALAGLY